MSGRLRVKELCRRLLHSAMSALLRLRAGRYRFPGTETMLVLAPHPDDETLGCGGLISQRRLQGDSVHVLYITDGEAAFPDSKTLAPASVASMRRAEACSAMRILGVDLAEMTFLSVPDGTLKDLGAAAAAALESRIATVILRLRPDQIFLPCRRDGSSEHEAAFTRAMGALAQSGLRPRIFQYPVWARWSPRGLVRLLGAKRVWRVGEEGFWDVKRRAIGAYVSQVRGVPPDDAPSFPRNSSRSSPGRRSSFSKNSVKKVLIVSPHFPPINAPDMQRVRMSLPFYREGGWKPVVLAVGEPWQIGVREPELESTVPADVRIVRTRAFPPRLSRFFGIGNLGLRALPCLFWSGCAVLRREKFDLVFMSNTQFATFILGPIWKRLYGVPYVLDVQDPWRTDYYERPGSRSPPGGWKYQIARFIAWAFEGRCFKRASGIVSVSPDYIKDLCSRYPGVARIPAAVIGFGASPGDVAKAREHVDAKPPFPRGDGSIHLVYTGASGPVMPHAIQVLFDGFRLYRERHPGRAARFRFHFIGTSYLPEGKGVESVIPVAVECGVADQVFETPHRVGFLEAIRLQDAADVLLILGSSDLAYSPSKIYLYYLTGRPILGLVFRTSVMERLLDELSCAFMVLFSEDQPKDKAFARLADFFDLAIEGFPSCSLPARNDEVFEKRYLARGLARRQCELFDAACGAGPCRHKS